MPTTLQQIELWCQTPSEHQRLEFKEAKSQLDFGRTCEYCVALANEGGGHLVLGISDTPPRKVVGTGAFRNVLKTAQDLFQAVGFRVDIDEVTHPNGRVLVLNIPARPRGTAYHLEGRYLMRSGEALVPMSEDQLRTIFAEGRPDWLEENSISSRDAQEVVKLLDTQAYFDLLKLQYPTTLDGVIDRLVAERLIEGEKGQYAIRRLGALLLAKSLDEFPDLQRKAARIIVYSGTSKLETKLDQVWARGYAAGFRGMLRFIMGQLPQNEVIQDALRLEVKLVPEIAIRELVANALIHQDFAISGTSVMVEIYSDRVEISNPGVPVVAIERFIDGYESRNERLADLMRRFGICEEKGSGIDRVIDQAEVYQLPAPDFRAGYRRTACTIYGPRDFSQMNKEDRIRACFQHCVLKYVMSQRMTNQSLRNRFHLPEEKSALVSQMISATMEVGWIKLDQSAGGSKKYARYIPWWA